MNRIFKIFSLLVLSVATQAQVLVDDTNTLTEPDASAVLEINSANKGLLLPRLNANPASPSQGLVYFNQLEKCFRAFDGTNWHDLNECTPFVAAQIYFNSESDVQVEGNSGPQTYSGLILASSNVLDDTTVTLSISGATGYTVASPVTITAGTNSAPFTVSWTGNTTVEPDAELTVTITSVSPSTAVLGTPTTFELTVTNDDVAAEANVPFTENMGSTNTSSPYPVVSAYTEYANYGDLSFSGTADVRGNSTYSTGYTGASGGNNVLINANNEYFQIGGIDASSLTGPLTLSVGIYKNQNAETGSTLSIQYSSDNGGSWTPLSFSLPTGSGTSGWYLRSFTTIPNSVTDIKFTRTSGSVEFRIDDVTLTN